MASNIERLLTFIIHYTPLSSRLTAQRQAHTWSLLRPSIITECVYSSSQNNTNLLSVSSPRLKWELMSQLSLISPLLLHHVSSLRKNCFVRPLEELEMFPRVDREPLSIFYRQAISSYGKKNYCLSKQHITALRCFLSTGFDYCLILEDDSIPIASTCLDLLSDLDQCISCADLCGAGFFDLSDSLGFKPKPDFLGMSDRFIRMTSGQTRCSSAYLLSQCTAKLIVQSESPIVMPIDWHLAFLLCLYSHPTYWFSKPIFSQGSQSGHFDSNQSSRNL